MSKYVTKRQAFSDLLKKKYGDKYFTLSDAADIYQKYISPDLYRSSAVSSAWTSLKCAGAQRGSSRGTYCFKSSAAAVSTVTASSTKPTLAASPQPATSLTADEALQLVTLVKKLFNAA
jgi:hypothetical protein